MSTGAGGAGGGMPPTMVRAISGADFIRRRQSQSHGTAHGAQSPETPSSPASAAGSPATGAPLGVAASAAQPPPSPPQLQQQQQQQQPIRRVPSVGAQPLAPVPQASTTLAADDATLGTMSPVLTLADHRSPVYGMCAHPWSQTVWTGASDWSVRVWSASTGDFVHRLQLHRGTVRCLAPVARDAVWSGSLDKQIRVWSASTLECTATVKAHTAGVDALLPVDAGAAVWSASGDGHVRLWDAATCAGMYDVEVHRGGATCLSTSAGRTPVPTDDAAAATGADTPELLWTAGADGRVASIDRRDASAGSRWRAHDNAVRALEQSGAGTFLWSACAAAVRVWDTRRTAAPLVLVAAPRGAEWSTMRRVAGFVWAAASDGSATQLDLAQVVGALDEVELDDGRRALWSASWDQVACCWLLDASVGQACTTLDSAFVGERAALLQRACNAAESGDGTAETLAGMLDALAEVRGEAARHQERSEPADSATVLRELSRHVAHLADACMAQVEVLARLDARLARLEAVDRGRAAP